MNLFSILTPIRGNFHRLLIGTIIAETKNTMLCNFRGETKHVLELKVNLAEGLLLTVHLFWQCSDSPDFVYF
jgi:hypothetical protein